MNDYCPYRHTLLVSTGLIKQLEMWIEFAVSMDDELCLAEIISSFV